MNKIKYVMKPMIIAAGVLMFAPAAQASSHDSHRTAHWEQRRESRKEVHQHRHNHAKWQRKNEVHSRKFRNDRQHYRYKYNRHHRGYNYHDHGPRRGWFSWW